jgi:phage tail sheath protein FI
MAKKPYPGVYVEEVPAGTRPIEATSTSTAAFVGVAQKGPDDRAIRITSWQGYQKHFGGFITGGYLAESVYQYFNNGGRQCYVVRVTGTGAVTAAFEKLDKITDVSLLAVPGVPGMFDEGVAYCENRPLRDIFFIGETGITLA